MRRSSVARLAGVLAGLVLTLAIAPVALAKEGVSVNLLAPLPGDAQPGDTVAVFFRMTAIEDDIESPLKSGAPFIRLTGPTGATTEALGVAQKQPAVYRALIEIPKGGVARADFGIHGAARSASGKVVATDPLWFYDGVVVAAKPPAAVDPGTFALPAGDRLVAVPKLATGLPAAPASAATPIVAIDARAIALALVVVVGMVGALMAIRLRRPHTSAA